MCVLLPSGETRNYICVQKERSRLRDCSIQVVIPGNLVSPVAAPPPPQAAASTALGRSEIIKYMKLKVLPDPDSPELMVADKNSAT